MNYKDKYFKYKKKYLKLKRISGGMDHEKKGIDENCEMCFVKLNNETNQCSDSKAFKKVLSDGRIVCTACCEALEFMEDSKPSTTVAEKPKEVTKTTVETTIKCSNCGNSYSPSLQKCNVCDTPNPLFLRQPKKRKKKKTRKKKGGGQNLCHAVYTSEEDFELLQNEIQKKIFEGTIPEHLVSIDSTGVDMQTTITNVLNSYCNEIKPGSYCDEGICKKH